MTEHLKQALEARGSPMRAGNPVPMRNVVVLLARGGLLLEAEELFRRRFLPSTPDARREMIERRREIVEGVLALSRGQQDRRDENA